MHGISSYYGNGYYRTNDPVPVIQTDVGSNPPTIEAGEAYLSFATNNYDKINHMGTTGSPFGW